MADGLKYNNIVPSHDPTKMFSHKVTKSNSPTITNDEVNIILFKVIGEFKGTYRDAIECIVREADGFVMDLMITTVDLIEVLRKEHIHNASGYFDNNNARTMVDIYSYLKATDNVYALTTQVIRNLGDVPNKDIMYNTIELIKDFHSIDVIIHS